MKIRAGGSERVTSAPLVRDGLRLPLPRWLPTLALVLSLLLSPVVAHAPNPLPVIHIYSDTLTKNELAKAMAAIQIQIDRDFFPAWGYRARLTLLDGPGEWQFLVTSDDTFRDDRCFCWGRHTVIGVPTGFVFMSRVKKYPVDWSLVMSHEILEMLSDPYLDQFAIINGHKIPIEIGDPVIKYGYRINEIVVQDFVLRNYYVPGSDGPWDFLHELSDPWGTVDTGSPTRDPGLH